MAISSVIGRASKRRSGFTVLEVLLASAIAVLLFGGLYAVMQVELKEAHEGRDAIERATVARGIINRLTVDLTLSLTPPQAVPQSASSAASSAAGSSSTGSGTASGAGSTTSGASTTAASSASGSGATTSTSTTTQTPYIPLQSGVICYNNQLVIYTSVSIEPQKLIDDSDVNSNTTAFPSDLRRITYSLGANGLCRQELPWFTNDDFIDANDLVLEQGKMEDDYLIAREVTDLYFEFYNLNPNNPNATQVGWQTTWDGSLPGPDGVTPQGPPAAIRVSFAITRTDADGKSVVKNYKHVIPIATASGPYAIATSATGTGATTGAASSSTSGQ